jgi:hypothetical protein
MVRMIQCILDWSKDNSDAVTALASVAGIAIAIIGFWLTIRQLQETQIALKAGNTYAIQKDARELIREIMDDQSFNDFVLNHNPQKKYAAKTIEDANRCTAVMFNFYLSVFRQHKTSGISDEFARSMGRDFSAFMSKAAVRAYYNQQREAQVYDVEHQAMVELWGSSQLDKTRS